jgi:ERCC4-type nuclease
METLFSLERKRFTSLPKDLEIIIDTREQCPLFFSNSRNLKLDFGDYTLGGEHYSYTYVDRKTATDFLGTMKNGIQRFEKEIQRAISFGCFLYIVVEDTIQNIENHIKFQSAINKGSGNSQYAFHQMRELLHKYPRHIQFVFTGNRAKSCQIIPYLLYYGKKLWDTDIQHLTICGTKANKTEKQ